MLITILKILSNHTKSWKIKQLIILLIILGFAGFKSSKSSNLKLGTSKNALKYQDKINKNESVTISKALYL